MAVLKHELWLDAEGLEMFCLAGPMGADARKMLPAGSTLVWTVDAASHFEAMTKCYRHLGLADYKTQYAWDLEPYPEDWLEIQRR